MSSLFAHGRELFEMHFKEISANQDIPMNIDEDKYYYMEKAGMLKIFSAWSGEKIVGYSIYIVNRNIRYRDSLQAVQDVLFIHPDYRGKNGEFIFWCDDRLREDGVQIVLQHVKVKHDWGSLLEKNGYKQVEKIYSRRLDRG